MSHFAEVFWLVYGGKYFLLTFSKTKTASNTGMILQMPQKESLIFCRVASCLGSELAQLRVNTVGSFQSTNGRAPVPPPTWLHHVSTFPLYHVLEKKTQKIIDELSSFFRSDGLVNLVLLT